MPRPAPPPGVVVRVVVVLSTACVRCAASRSPWRWLAMLLLCPRCDRTPSPCCRCFPFPPFLPRSQGSAAGRAHTNEPTNGSSGTQHTGAASHTRASSRRHDVDTRCHGCSLWRCCSSFGRGGCCHRRCCHERAQLLLFFQQWQLPADSSVWQRGGALVCGVFGAAIGRFHHPAGPGLGRAVRRVSLGRVARGDSERGLGVDLAPRPGAFGGAALCGGQARPDRAHPRHPAGVAHGPDVYVLLVDGAMGTCHRERSNSGGGAGSGCNRTTLHTR